jgi:hypothetical protein
MSHQLAPRKSQTAAEIGGRCERNDCRINPGWIWLGTTNLEPMFDKYGNEIFDKPPVPTQTVTCETCKKSWTLIYPDGVGGAPDITEAGSGVSPEWFAC